MIRASRIALAAVLCGAAAVLVFLALDVLRWRDAIGSGDRAFARSPASATWQASTLLPGDPARGLLGLGPALRFRAGEQAFAAVEAAGNGYDNGFSEAHARGELEAELAALGMSGQRPLASEADNLLGILAFADATQTGPMAPAPAEQSVADFQAAVRLDPADVDAKFNLELVLRALIAKGVRHGASNAPGKANGHSGAGGGLAGSGY